MSSNYSKNKLILTHSLSKANMKEMRDTQYYLDLTDHEIVGEIVHAIRQKEGSKNMFYKDNNSADFSPSVL